MNTLKKLIFIILLAVIFGCEGGFLTVESYDPKTGRTIKKIYTPAFLSNSGEIDENFYMAITVKDEEKVNPFYPIAMKMGLLGPGDLVAPATLVVHLENLSSQSKSVMLNSIRVFGEEYTFFDPMITVGPGGKTQTEEIKIKISKYESEMAATLVFIYAFESYEMDFSIQRQTIEEMQQRR